MHNRSRHNPHFGALIVVVGGGGSGGGRRARHVVKVLHLRLAVVLVRVVSPPVEELQRRPEAAVVRVFDGVRVADEPDARAFVRRAPRHVILEGGVGEGDGEGGEGGEGGGE